MDMDSATNAVSEEHLQVEETDDSCRLDVVVPLTRDTDGSCRTECVSGDWPAEVKQENMEQEPDDVIDYLFYHSRKKICRSLVRDRVFWRGR